MRSRALLLTMAAQVLLAPVLLCAAKSDSMVVWPGYILELPPNHCFTTDNGPDFHVLYLRDRQSSQHVILAGIYAGFAPNFRPECAKPATRKWSANNLSFQSVRSADGCAEFLVNDPANTQRGYLHIWFGPGAKEHSQMAEALIASIRPAPMPLKDVPASPSCN